MILVKLSRSTVILTFVKLYVLYDKPMGQTRFIGVCIDVPQLILPLKQKNCTVTATRPTMTLR